MKLLKANESFDVTKKTNDKEFEKKSLQIIAITETLMSHLSENATIDIFPKVLSFFMALAFTERSFLP